MGTAMRLGMITLAMTWAVGPALALDCARVKALHGDGKKPSEIARELGITTPDVQACLADQQPAAADAPQKSRGLSAGPSVPAAGGGARREPTQ